MKPLELLELDPMPPAGELALDEALLIQREESSARDGDEQTPELLRIWESDIYYVVLGVSGRIAEEVDRQACALRKVPILRRHSGGGTVLQGPGCLNFSLILSLERRPELRNFTRSYREILGATAAGLALPGVEPQGVSDLALAGKKFSGNAQKRKGRSVLHHGTLLYGFDLARIDALLPEPARRPPYRGERAHREFLMNLPLSRAELRARLTSAWNAHENFNRPLPELAGLIREKYGNEKWTERF